VGKLEGQRVGQLQKYSRTPLRPRICGGYT